MLIGSHRFRPGDIEHWHRLEKIDAVMARSHRLADKEARAIDVMRRFLDDAPAYVGVSWGKDSVVVAHLATRLNRTPPIVWFPAGALENPDNARVRDAFMARFASLDYREVDAGPTAMNGDAVMGHDGAQAEFEVASAQMGGRYISGVRAEESGIRKLCIATHGESSTNTCRPIGNWTGADVFAYLHKHDLPIHPAYAMTMGGRLDRARIRVATIGGERGRGKGRRQWEQLYYGPELAQIEGMRDENAEAWDGR